MRKFESRASSAFLGSVVARPSNRLQQAKCFHATLIPEAPPAARRSPRVMAKSQSQAGTIRVRVKQPLVIEDSLPPIVLLNSARKSGVLRVEPESVLEFLRQYQQLTVNPSGTWERKLCDEHNIDPTAVAALAGILRRCPENAQRSLAKKLMLTASALGDNSATFEIISGALRLGTLHGYTAPLQRLGLLAKNGDPQALSLLGKVHYAQRETRQALDCFRKATRPPTGSLEFDGAGEALINEGRILMEMDDKDGAKAAFEKAALELDDPSGYFYLAKFQKSGSSEQHVYLLKAASTGVLEAHHNLGALELAKRKENATKKPTTLSDFGMAYEWFQVAAADGFGLSMLNLALMCKSVGNIEEGMKWLEKAEKNADVREQARAIKAQFHNGNVGAI